MKGLIIKAEWLNKIFFDNKEWEIRGSNTKVRGKIYLIQSGSKTIVGECEVVDSIKLDLDQYQKNTDKHGITVDLEKLPYKTTYAWVLRNSKKFDNPIPYCHPMGAVIWVNIK